MALALICLKYSATCFLLAASRSFAIICTSHEHSKFKWNFVEIDVVTLIVGRQHILLNFECSWLVQMMANDRDAARRKHVAEYFKQIKANAIKLTQRNLVAIYEERMEPRVKTEQIGTSFLISHRGRAVLITAKHVLYGHNGDENPGEKAVFAAGSLKMIGHLNSHELVSAKDHDIVAMHVEEFVVEQCIPSSCLSPADATPRVVTIQGFLARDLKREAVTGTLRPAPRIYTNVRKDYSSGYVGLRYPKSRNRSSDTEKKVMAPRPSGMSGGPMLDGAS